MTKPNKQNMLAVLKEAGVTIPNEHELHAKIASALSKHGVEVEPDWYICGGSGYGLVVQKD